jgi:hypothetical protein
VSEDVIPADLRSFIARYIDSVADLEALLLLRSDPARKWTLSAIAQRLYVGESETSAALSRLCADGLAAHADGFFRYDCSPVLAPLVDRLEEAYRRQLIPVTNLIHAKPDRIQQFADAFRLMKDR